MVSKKEEVAEYLSDIVELIDLSDDEDIIGLSPVVFSFLLDKCDKTLRNLIKIIRDISEKSSIKTEDLNNMTVETLDKLTTLMKMIEKMQFGQSVIIYFINKPGEKERFIDLLGGDENSLLDLLSRLLVELRNIVNQLQKIKNRILRRDFRGRSSVRNTAEISSIIEKLSNIHNNLAEYEAKLRRLYNILSDVLYGEPQYAKDFHRLRSMKDSLGKFQVAQQLKIRARSRLYSAKMLDILTGLSSITASPSFEQIEFRLKELSPREEPFYLNLEELFTRYPPYEPISVKLPLSLNYGKVRVAGSRLWFIECEEIIRKESNVRFREGSGIYGGEARERAGSILLDYVEPVDVLTRGKGETYITFFLPDRREKIFFKYGSEKLRNTIRKCVERGLKDPNDIEKCVKEKYLRFIGSRRRKSSYDPLDLSYVWYCGIGKGLSTDPWDIRCPFEKQCKYARMGGYRKKEHCTYWSRNRRIFPRIFPQINIEVHMDKAEDEDKFSIFRFFTARHVYVVENYVGLQWRMPAYIGDGIPVSVNFKKPLVKELPDTNILGMEFPLEIIRRLGALLLDEKIEAPSVDLGYDRSVKLSDLLISKFFLWLNTERGMRSYEYLRKSTRKILEEYLRFRDNLKNEEEYKKNFQLFIAKLIAHTLAHLLLAYLASSLDLNFDDLIYSYVVDEEEGRVKIYVAENSPYGNLDLPGQVKMYFGSISEMSRKFLQDTSNMLDRHQHDIMESLNARIFVEKRFLSRNDEMREFLEELRKLYKNMVDKGLVLDQWYFGLHLLLSNEFEKYIEEYGIDKNKAFQHFDEIIPLAGPPTCLDGCNDCVMFEKKCRETLGQHLSVSRGLTKLFIDFFLGKQDFRGIGGETGSWILEVLPRKKLVAVSPFIDKEGVALLKRLADKGIMVTLITREEMLGRIPSDIGFRVAIQGRRSHEKIYIIDGEFIVKSSWNLTVSSKSWETFMLKWNIEEAHKLEKEFLGEAKWIS